MTTEINKVAGVYVGEYGDPIILTLINNGVVQDVSAYSTSQAVRLLSPDELKELTYVASFVTDGSDGKVQFTPANGDIDREGKWTGQVILNAAAAQARSKIFTVIVGRGLA